MDAIEALIDRVSVPRPGSAMPSEQSLQIIYQAALRAPDHAQLRPWRYLTVSGDDRLALGDLFLQAALAKEPDMGAEQQHKTRHKPMRAPLVIVAIASLQKHPKVPEVEQIASAAAGVQSMLLAAHAQGLGAMWRTGSMAYDAIVLKGLGLTENERLVGYLYLGSAPEKRRIVTALEAKDFVQPWPHQK